MDDGIDEDKGGAGAQRDARTHGRLGGGGYRDKGDLDMGKGERVK